MTVHRYSHLQEARERESQERHRQAQRTRKARRHHLARQRRLQRRQRVQEILASPWSALIVFGTGTVALFGVVMAVSP